MFLLKVFLLIVFVIILAETKAFFQSILTIMRSSLASLLSLCSFSLVSLTYAHAQSDAEAGENTENYKIEGKVTPPDNPAPDWLSVTTVTLDGGKRRAFLRDDQSFVFQVEMSLIDFSRHVTYILSDVGFVSWELSCRG